jgi:hypothetical protein
MDLARPIVRGARPSGFQPIGAANESGMCDGDVFSSLSSTRVAERSTQSLRAPSKEASRLPAATCGFAQEQREVNGAATATT